MKKKTIYWDIETEVRMKKALGKKYIKKNRVSASKIIRLWVASPAFDRHIEELNNELE
jgi:hypothetical protein